MRKCPRRSRHSSANARWSLPAGCFVDGTILQWILSTFVQTQGPSHGVFVDPASVASLANTTAMVQALEVMRRLRQAGPLSGGAGAGCRSGYHVCFEHGDGTLQGVLVKAGDQQRPLPGAVEGRPGAGGTEQWGWWVGCGCCERAAGHVPGVVGDAEAYGGQGSCGRWGGGRGESSKLHVREHKAGSGLRWRRCGRRGGRVARAAA